MIPSIQDSYNQEIKNLNFFGCRPIVTKSKLTQAFWYLMRYMIITMNIVEFSAMVYQMVLTNELAEFSETFYYCATHCSAYYKILNVMLRPKTLQRIEEMLCSSSFNLTTPHQYKLLRKSYKFTRIFAGIYRMLILFTLIGYSIFPIIDGKGNFPFPGTFPFSDDYYRIIYVWQMVTIIIYTYCNATVDVVSIILIQAAADQFDILKDRLTRIKQTTDGEVEKELKLNVKFHNDIFLFIEMIQDMFNIGFFCQFVGGIIVISFSLLQLMIIPLTNIAQIFTTGIYLFCMVFQVGMYCWFGQKVLFKSHDVIDACYMSEWYNLSISNKKFLFLIMERAKRPTYVTAWKFFVLSLGSFVMIMKTSYSYFAVFRNVYDS